MVLNAAACSVRVKGERSTSPFQDGLCRTKFILYGTSHILSNGIARKFLMRQRKTTTDRATKKPTGGVVFKLTHHEPGTVTGYISGSRFFVLNLRFTISLTFSRMVFSFSNSSFRFICSRFRFKVF